MKGFLLGAVLVLFVNQVFEMVRTAQLIAQVDAMDYSVHYELAKLRIEVSK